MCEYECECVCIDYLLYRLDSFGNEKRTAGIISMSASMSESASVCLSA